MIVPLAVLIVRTFATLDQSSSLMVEEVISAILISLGTTTISIIIIIMLGVPLAYVFARFDFPLKSLLNVLIELPIVMPPVVAGLALLMTFGRRGLLGPPLDVVGITLPFTTAGVVTAQVFVSMPFFVRAAQVRFQSVPMEIEAAAMIDGASSWQIFWRITLPLSLKGLVAGLLLSWARASGEFGATILFAGSLRGRTQTMPLLVYNALERDLNAALWSALILIGIAILALGAMRWLAQAVADNEDEDPLSTVF